VKILLILSALLLTSAYRTAVPVVGGRTCQSYFAHVDDLLGGGFIRWWSYRPDFADHRVEYWSNKNTNEVTRIIVPPPYSSCSLGGGTELEIHKK